MCLIPRGEWDVKEEKKAADRDDDIMMGVAFKPVAARINHLRAVQFAHRSNTPNEFSLFYSSRRAWDSRLGI